jgi:hypothetical protein
MLAHLLGVARTRGFRRVSLETGTTAAFAPARALYENAGFIPCGPFADYQPSEDNLFMTLELGAVQVADRVTGTAGCHTVQRPSRVHPLSRAQVAVQTGATRVGCPDAWLADVGWSELDGTRRHAEILAAGDGP